MAKFERKMTPEQEHELYRAVVHLDGPRMSIRRAHRMGCAGELGTAGPWTISYTRACELVAEERERVEGIGRARETSRDPQAAIDGMLKRLLKLEDREVSRIERAANAARAKRDPARTMAAVRNIRAIRQALNEGDGTAKPRHDPGKDDARDAGVLAKARAAMESEPSDDPSETPSEADTHGATAAQDEATTHEEENPREKDAAPVLSLARADLERRRRAGSGSSAQAGV